MSVPYPIYRLALLATSPGVKLALVGHQEDLDLLLEADGSLGGRGGARQWHGGAAAVPVVVLVPEAVERGPGGERRLVAVGSCVPFKVVHDPCRLLVGAGRRGGAAPIAPNLRPSPLLLPRQHAFPGLQQPARRWGELLAEDEVAIGRW